MPIYLIKNIKKFNGCPLDRLMSFRAPALSAYGKKAPTPFSRTIIVDRKGDNVTSKERILRAIQRKSVDRIPTTLRASKYLSESILKHFGVENSPNLAVNHRVMLQKTGADFWSSGTKLDKFSTFFPFYSGPKPQPPYVDDGNNYYTIGIKALPSRIAGFDIEYPHIGVEPPLGAVEGPNDIPDDFFSSRLDLFNFNVMSCKYRDAEAQDIYRNDNDLVCLGAMNTPFMMCCFLRGMENFMLDLAMRPKLVERLLGLLSEFILEFNRLELEALGEFADYYGSWDDVAGQQGIMFSPEQFKKYFLPIHKKLIDQNKKYGLHYGWHCCGSVHQVLPMMIDAGIDVFDVVQTSARDMDIEYIYRQYGQDVCLHGALDVQTSLVEKTAGRIREEVRRIKELWGERGGMILAPSHEAMLDVPVENILAIYQP